MAARRMAGFERTAYKAFANFLPPEKMTVSQWAEKYRVLSRESAAEAGPWRNSRTPYMVEPMDAFDDPRVHDIAVVAMSQTGKSELELNIIGKLIDKDPCPILYIQPDIGEAKKFSTVRVAPMIRDCKVLRSKVAEVKSRDTRNTMLQKSFPGGMLTMVGSQTPSALASMPVRCVIGDEIDRWALSAGSEGDPWELAEKRTTTFYNAKRVAVSTPTTLGESRIADLFEKGTQEKWYSRCPHCGEWREVLFGDIKFDFETIKRGRKVNYKLNSVAWCCPACGCLSSEKEMRDAPAKWVAENPEAINRGRRSFWVNAFFSPWRTWDEIVLKFLEVRKDPQQLKVFYNTILGQLWEDRGDLADEDTMLSRREDYGTHDNGAPVELPEGVLFLTCAVDTQNDRLEYEVKGWGHYMESWGIKKGIIPGDPNDAEVWSRLDGVLDHQYSFENGRSLKIAITFVDSGGNKTQSVYKNCYMRQHKKVFAIKGKGGEGIPHTKPASRIPVEFDGPNGKVLVKVWLYVLGVDAGKTDILKGHLKVVEPGPKFCHYPTNPEAGYDLNYFNGLLSENEVTVRERGRTVKKWKVLPGHERNEPLDLHNYNLAAFRAFNPDLEKAEQKLKGWGSTPAQPTAQPKRRTGAKKNSALGGDDW